jgi:outer membrane autotransporter protein
MDKLAFSEISITRISMHADRLAKINSETAVFAPSLRVRAWTVSASVSTAALAAVFLIVPSILPQDLTNGAGRAWAACTPVATTGNDVIICDPIAGLGDGWIGDDHITIISGSASLVQGGNGNDTLIMNGGTITDYFSGGDDNDTMTVNGGAPISVQGDKGDDTIILLGGRTREVQGDNFDSTQLYGPWIGGNDTIILNGTVVDTYIVGESGNDTIWLLSGSVGTDVHGDGGGADPIYNEPPGPGNDTIILNGATVVGTIFGDQGDDTIQLLSGSSAAVSGGDGNDAITLNGATIAGAISGDAGNDVIQLLSGSAAVVLGGAGNDAILLDGATIADSINGEAGDDTITFRSGSSKAILGGFGNDVINLVGGSFTGTISGDEAVASVADGNDTFIWSGGTLTGAFRGQNGSDTALVTTSNYNGTQLLDGGDDVAVADGWIDRLTLRGPTATAPGATIVNWEVVTLDAASLTLSDGALTVGSDPGTGLFLSNGSTLDGLNAFALTGNMTIDGSSSFVATGGGAGVYAVSGTLANAGTVTMQDGAAGDVLTVGGNYVSNSGRLLLDTVLGADASASDRLVIQANSVVGSGATSLLVANTTGGGALTTGDGIQLVQVDGASAAGAFTLGGRVAAGAYEYTLNHNGVGANAANGDWYLRSTYIPPVTPPVTPPAPASEPVVQLPNYRAEVPVDMVVPALANRFGLAMLGTYHDRVGEDYADLAGAPARPIWCKDPANGFRCLPTAQQNAAYADAATGEGERRKAVWARVFGDVGEVGYGAKGILSRYSGFEKHGPSYDFGLAGAQIGMDVYRKLNDNGTRDIAGLYVGAGRIDSEVNAVYGGKAGSTSMDGYSLGAYWTRKGASGWYVDAVVQGSWYDRIKANSVLGESLKTDGWGLTTSLEAGYPVALGSGWAIEPQAQVIYQRVSIDDGADNFGRVNYDDTNAVYGRLGARLTKGWTMDDGRSLTVWGRANLWHTFGADAKTTFTNLAGNYPVTLNTDLGGTWAQFGLGVSGQVTKSTSVFASGDYNLALGEANGHSISGRLGLKVVW